MNKFLLARLHTGLSQKAAAISLGVKAPSISGWESGSSRPSQDHLKSMAELYHVSIDELLTDDQEPLPLTESSSFPQRIISIRKNLGMTQEAFGEMIGMSQRTIANWESGSRAPTLAILVRLADILSVSTDFLLGLDDNMQQKKPTAEGDRLRVSIIKQVLNLPDSILIRLSDFLSGIAAGQETAAPLPADPDPGVEPGG